MVGEPEEPFWRAELVFVREPEEPLWSQELWVLEEPEGPFWRSVLWVVVELSLIHISEPTRPPVASRMPSSA